MSAGVLHPSAPPRFLADQMMARVARWLRLLGYDCDLVQGGRSDEALVNRARLSGRILLTSARSLGEMYPESVLTFPPGDLHGAVRTVTARWPLDYPSTSFTRCSVCNVPVEAVDREAVRDLLPRSVREQDWPVHRCPSCKRLYWIGGHVERLRNSFARNLGLDTRPKPE